MRPTMARIDLDILEDNIRKIQKTLKPNTSVMAIVKANAYGHGIVEISRRALKAGATSLGVAIPEEGVLLRRNNIDCPILILGGLHPEQIDLALEYDLSLCAFTVDTVESIQTKAKEKGKIAKIHIKIDSGMGRIGLRWDKKAIALAESIKKCQNLYVEGIYTHLATADDKASDFILRQLETFDHIVKKIKSVGIHPKWIHSANTAGIANHSFSHYDLVRPGIGIYGYGIEEDFSSDLDLKPILSWSTKIIYIKSINKGDSVSYGRTFIAHEPKIVATLPVGYGDGYNRLLSNKGWVLIRGTKAPIIGRVCMDQTMVDVTHIPDLKVGEEAVLIGHQGEETITADDLAKLCNTISYEILTNLSPRVERVYIRSQCNGTKK